MKLPCSRSSQRVTVRLRCSAGFVGQPSRGLPTVAHAHADKRERRVASPKGYEEGRWSIPATFVVGIAA